MNVEGDEPGGRKVSLRARLAAARPAPTTVGILCGAGAALFWAAGFVAARHGIAIGY